MMNLDLIGKNALVCGGSQGIGKAAAIELAELGANVTIMARRQEKLRAAILDLDTSRYQRHQYITADFSDYTQVSQILSAHLKEEDITYQILVNNSGGPPAGMLMKAGTDELERAFHQHVLSSHVIVQLLINGMKQSGYGRIINIVSTSVKEPIAGLGVSNTVRGAVANWAKTLAKELAPWGITVNNVLPGATLTDRMQEILNYKSQQTGQSKDEIAEAMRRDIPVGRFADPREIGAAVAFLASPAAAYINGVNLVVDGGRTSCL